MSFEISLEDLDGVVAEKTPTKTKAQTYTLSSEMYQAFYNELQCAVCKCVYQSPQTLPCRHIFCKGCCQRFITNQKTKSTSPKCPLCQFPFSRRSLQAATKIENIVQVFQEVRQANNLHTQIPSFQKFDPKAILERAREQRRLEEETKIAEEPPKAKSKPLP